MNGQTYCKERWLYEFFLWMKSYFVLLMPILRGRESIQWNHWSNKPKFYGDTRSLSFSFIHSCIHSFIHSFICIIYILYIFGLWLWISFSFIHSFVHSFCSRTVSIFLSFLMNLWRTFLFFFSFSFFFFCFVLSFMFRVSETYSRRL